MNPLELIALARALINGVTSDDAASPTRTELRRAVSCAYYAMFHTLAASNANSLAGASPADQQGWAWQQTYRAADHRPTRNKLSRTSLGGRFPRLSTFLVKCSLLPNKRAILLITIPAANSSQPTSPGSSTKLKSPSPTSTKPPIISAATWPSTSSPPFATTDRPDSHAQLRR